MQRDRGAFSVNGGEGGGDRTLPTQSPARENGHRHRLYGSDVTHTARNTDAPDGDGSAPHVPLSAPSSGPGHQQGPVHPAGVPMSTVRGTPHVPLSAPSSGPGRPGCQQDPVPTVTTSAPSFHRMPGSQPLDPVSGFPESPPGSPSVLVLAPSPQLQGWCAS